MPSTSASTTHLAVGPLDAYNLKGQTAAAYLIATGKKRPLPSVITGSTKRRRCGARRCKSSCLPICQQEDTPPLSLWSTCAKGAPAKVAKTQDARAAAFNRQRRKNATLSPEQKRVRHPHEPRARWLLRFGITSHNYCTVL
jgi:hypothetical protein